MWSVHLSENVVMRAIVEINWIAVVVAGVVRFAVGAIWYAPSVFGKRWQAADGIKGNPAEMPGAIVVQALGGLVMAYVLAQVIGHYSAENLVAGAFIGFLMWLGFVPTFLLPNVMFEKRSIVLFYIVAGFQLVSMVIMGAIIGAL
jgi:hypothetical protein